MFKKIAFAAALALAASSGLAAQSASADTPDPVTTKVERTGANPIVAGSGQTTTFKVTATNPNNYEVTAIIGGVLDLGLSATDISIDLSGWTCTPSGQQFTCGDFLKGPSAPSNMIPANGSAVVTVVALAESWVTKPKLDLCGATQSGLLTAPSEPVAPCGLTPPGNPVGTDVGIEYTEDTASVDISQVSRLALKATNAGQVNPGDDAEVSFTATNNGPSYNYPLTIKFTLPAGLTFKSSNPEWTCTTSGQDVTCEGGAVARPVRSGPSTPALVVTVGTAKPGTVSSYAIDATLTAKGTNPDPDAAEATATIDVTPVAYSLSKKASGRPYRVGEKVDWELLVKNSGSIDDAGTLSVVDTLPKSLVFKKSIGAGWDCSAKKQKVTCTHAGLAAGASSTVTLRTKMVSRGAVENVASLSTQSFSAGDVKASRKIAVFRSPQSAAALPSSPRRIKSGKTEQGRKLRTRVVCRPAASGAAGEVAYCRVSRSKGVVKVKVLGSQPVRVLVVQTARGTNKYRPFIQKQIYTVKP